MLRALWRRDKTNALADRKPRAAGRARTPAPQLTIDTSKGKGVSVMKARRKSKASIKTTFDRKEARARADRVKPDIPLPADWPQYTTHEYYTWMMRGMPQDAIVANWSQHSPHNSHSPIFWYQDKLLSCRDCGAEFVFTKNEQRVWYEEYKLPIQVKAVCCTICRRRQRKEKEAAKG